MADEDARNVGYPQPFIVEFGDDGCRTITLDTLRVQVRGRWSIATLHQRPEGGRDLGAAMSGMPEIPGQRLAVDPKGSKAVLFDPLTEDEQLCVRIGTVMNRGSILKQQGGVQGVPDQEFELTQDQLKTLCIELTRKVTGTGHGLHGVHVSAFMVEGELPTPAQISKMRGEELIEQWNEGRHAKYRKDVDAWNERLERQGTA